MKVLVATKETQGRRANDFCFAGINDLVRMPIECSSGYIDDPCGCHRSWTSTLNNKYTTTCKVIEDAAMTPEKLCAALAGGSGAQPEEMRAAAAYLSEVAGRFAVGTIIERRGKEFAERVAGVYGRGQRLGAVLRHLKSKRARI